MKHNHENVKEEEKLIKRGIMSERQTELQQPEFGIQIDDGMETLSDYTSNLNITGTMLREWQIRAKEFFFNHNCIALFEVSTGSGKTFAAIDLIKEIWKTNPDAKFLIVVPKNVILERGWYPELKDAGVPIQDIGIFYGAIKEYAKVTITNMQSINKMALEIFDGIIYDEVHNYLTKTMTPILKRKFKYKLGLSATIDRQDDRQWELIECFNYNKFEYTAKQALDDGVLNPFHFTNISVNLDSKSREEYDKLTADINLLYQMHGSYNTIMRTASTAIKKTLLTKLTERKKLVNNFSGKFEVVRDIIDEHREEKVLVFNEFNEQTNKLYWELLEIEVKAKILHSGVPQEERHQLLSDYRDGKFNILLSTKVLDEGYNLPAIEVGIIMAGNSTSRQTIQRMGRVLRKKDTPSTLYQIYVANTIEEEQAMERAKIFKELALQYRELSL